jgi:hypothetical protein
MRPFSRLVLFLALAMPISGCDQVNDLIGKKEDKKEKKKDKKDDDDDDDDKPASSASASASGAASATASADASATPSATPSSPDTAATASGSAPAPTATSLPGHSPVPTTAEWEAASEVTVTNSSKLGCETKSLREWVRVTCKGKNDTGGAPSGVSVQKGNEKNELFTYPNGGPSGGIASLVFPFAAGTDVAATFSWDDAKSSKFTSQWPNGSPKPAAYGKFDVAATAVATPTAPATVKPPVVDPPKKDPPKVEPPKKDPPKKERIPAKK